MSEQLLNTKLRGYEVSTIRTDAGGGKKSSIWWSPFTSADYPSLNTWPFETMVFKAGDRKGLYHEPYADEAAALSGHERIVAAVEADSLAWGQGVHGRKGNPSITPEEWNSRILGFDRASSEK